MREELMKKTYDELMKIFKENIQDAKFEIPSVQEHQNAQEAVTA